MARAKEESLESMLKKKFGNKYRPLKDERYTQSYWDHLEKRGQTNKQGRFQESKESNPDSLKEEEGLYYQRVLEDPKLGLIRDAWPTLTQQQKAVLMLCGFEGRSLDNCAIKLGLKKGTVQSILERLKKRFQKDVLRNPLLEDI